MDRKAAAVLDSLVGNQALADGNKRLGGLAAVVFHGLNEIDLDYGNRRRARGHSTTRPGRTRTRPARNGSSISASLDRG